MRTGIPTVVIAVACFVVLAFSGVQTARPVNPAAVPKPIVTGPIPATAPPGDSSHGYPFFSTTVDLASHGHVEEEYFFEGTANRYNMPAPENVTATATVTTARTSAASRV
jgi:hypothetical protein